jgi:hypothetical protein
MVSGLLVKSPPPEAGEGLQVQGRAAFLAAAR